MQDYRIVAATADDFAIIERIARQTWPSTFRGILSAEQIEYMLHLMYRPEALAEQVAGGHRFLLLLSPTTVRTRGIMAPTYPGGSAVRFRPVGYVSYQQDYLPGTTKIHKIYLLPSTQGRGYGKALLRKVERIAVNAGQQKLRLDVNYENKAVGFYEHYGFVKIGRFDTDIGNGYLMEDWQMEKPLVSTSP